MAFLIFGLFWMTQDHASLWWIVSFTVFQILESAHTDTTRDDRRDMLLRQILNKLEDRNVR